MQVQGRRTVLQAEAGAVLGGAGFVGVGDGGGAGACLAPCCRCLLRVEDGGKELLRAALGAGDLVFKLPALVLERPPVGGSI